MAGEHPCGRVIHEVDRNVFLGGADAATPEILSRYGITRVVRLYAGPPDIRAPGVTYHVIPAQDNPLFDIRPAAFEAVKHIKRARARSERILVHCHAGVSRSVTAILLYLMTEYRMSIDEAYAYLRRIRPCVAPNAGFMACLRATDASIRRLQSAKK